jgi:hypothetical protein
MRYILWLPFVAACGGPSEETLIPELRVVTVVSEPPVIAPGETLRSRVIIADPEGNGVEAAVWMCTPIGPATCAESSVPGPQPISSFARVVRGQTDFTVEFPISPSAAANIGAEKPPRLAIFACETGLCPEFDRVEADPEPGSEAWAEVALALAKPFYWLDEKPLRGVTLASRYLELTDLPVDQRRQNPVLTLIGDPPRAVPVGESAELEFEVTTDAPRVVQVYGFTDRGGMGPVSVEVVNGRASLSWFPGEEPGPATLWVTAEDGLGGSALWTVETESVE